MTLEDRKYTDLAKIMLRLNDLVGELHKHYVEHFTTFNQSLQEINKRLFVIEKMMENWDNDFRRQNR